MKLQLVRRLFLLLIVLGLSLGVTNVVFAKSVVWREYNFDITIQANGDMRVVETQVIDFQGGPFREGYAEIPLENTDGITDVSLAEPGQTYTEGIVGERSFSTFNDGDYLSVTWGLPRVSNETRTFILSYTIHGAVRQYETGDKIRHLIVAPVSSENDYTIYSSKVTVHLPPGGQIIDDPDSIGAPMEWQTALDNLSVTYQSTGPFNASDGLAIQVVFRHGAVAGPKPSWQAEFDQQEAYETQVKPWIDLGLWALSLGLLVAVPAGLYLIWYLWGRDPSAAVAPDYLPELPSDLPPGLVGALIDERADLRDVTATLIDLARRGLLTMEEVETAGAFGSTSKSYTLRKSPQSGSLRPYEQQLYSAVFSGGDTANLQALPVGFFTSLPRLEGMMYDEVVRAGLFSSNPETARGSYRGIGIGLIVLVVVLGCLLVTAAALISESVLCPLLPALLFGIGLVVLSGFMPARTRKGANETAKWRAFQKYLGNIQKYRDIGSAADQFEKYLPYAVAFGLERRWVNAFAQAPSAAQVPVPVWYRPWRRPLGPVVGTAPGAGGMPSVQVPNLNQMGEGLTGGLNSFGDSFVNALNAAGRSLSTPPVSASGGSYSYRGGGSRGFSGGRSTFRSGGGFRSGGFSGGGRRGFR